METVGFVCEFCGFPLEIPDGAGVVVCPCCRGSNAVRKSESDELRTLSRRIDANSNFQIKLYEVQAARDEYMKVFVPEKEKLGEYLAGEMARYDRLHPPKKWGFWHLLLLVLLGAQLYRMTEYSPVWRAAANGMISPRDFFYWLGSGEARAVAAAEIVLVVLFGIRLLRSFVRNSGRRAKKRELRRIWEKCLRDEEAHKAKIAKREEELKECHGTD